MILSDNDIKRQLEMRRILQEDSTHFSSSDFNKLLSAYLNITGMKDPDKQIQPASVDLSLGNKVLLFDPSDVNFRQGHIHDVTKPLPHGMMREQYISEDAPLILLQGWVALGCTAERIYVPPTMVGRVEGKSSLARLFLNVHSTAGFIDPGNELNITLELANIGPLALLLKPGIPVCQIAFHKLSSQVERTYEQVPQHKYYGSTGPEQSKMHLNFKSESRGLDAI